MFVVFDENNFDFNTYISITIIIIVFINFSSVILFIFRKFSKEIPKKNLFVNYLEMYLLFRLTFQDIETLAHDHPL